jgi:hypothetical protein
MISNELEYEQALEELQSLEQLLAEMRQESRPYRPDLEMLGVRRLVARLHEELGQYEGDATRPLRETGSVRRSATTISRTKTNP